MGAFRNLVIAAFAGSAALTIIATDGAKRSAAPAATAAAAPAPNDAPKMTAASGDDGQDRTVDNAYELCRRIDATHLMSDQCAVSGWNQTVTIAGNMTIDNAQQICAALAGDLKAHEKHFNRGWKLKIKSPFSGDSPIAYCDLPT